MLAIARRRKSATHHRGLMTLEFLVVVAIASILLMLAVPTLSSTYSKNTLDAAESTLAQTLHRAQQLAMAQNTLVTVTASGNTFILSSLRDPRSHASVNLPPKIVVDGTVTMTFNPIGIVRSLPRSLTMKHTSDSANKRSRTYTISAVGRLVTS